MAATRIDICAGGTVRTNQITFSNDHAEPCTITGLGKLVDCGDSFTVPARSGAGPGTKTCNVSGNASKKSYPYNASCCGKGPDTNPVIIYQ
ncbi:MAG TPA: hypothetical protein VKW06_03200 [Candidatus Angelobacter sp.]|nr:hypothetical protein [Candidatus Angelobacter sp.]